MAHVESIFMRGWDLRYPGKVLHSNIDLIFMSMLEIYRGYVPYRGYELQTFYGHSFVDGIMVGLSDSFRLIKESYGRSIS